MITEIISSISSVWARAHHFANESVLKFYVDNKDWVSFIKDIVYFWGAYALLKYLWNRNYSRKTKEIAHNLQFRDRIEKELEAYVIRENKNGIKDISIRFVYWKNYPRKLAADGFKHILQIEYHNDQIIGSSWIDNTGIFFQNHLWFFSTSAYVDKNGIFFFAPEGHSYRGFTEHKNRRLITHVPYTNIVNFDFKEIIEYEPVFYTKHYYTNYKKLDSDNYILRERHGQPYFNLELDRRKQLKKYSWLAYIFSRAKAHF